MILSLMWMVVIFMYSSRNAELSTERSHEVGMMIGQVTISDFEDWSYDRQISFAQSIDHPVRKTAHFIEYAVLGIFLFGAWTDRKRKSLINIIIPFIVGAVYALSDELHQLLVAGRAGMFSDVLLDSSGVISGILIVFLIISVFRAVSSQNK